MTTEVKFQSYVKKVANTRLDQKVNISDKAKNALSEWLNLQGTGFVAAAAAQPGSKTIMPQTVGAAAQTFFSAVALETIQNGMNQSLQSWNDHQSAEKTKKAEANDDTENTESHEPEEKKRQSKSDLAGLKLPVPKVRSWLKDTTRRVSEEATIMATAALEYWLVSVLAESLEHAHLNKRRGINADDVLFAATQSGVTLSSPPEHDEDEDKDAPSKKRGRKRKGADVKDETEKNNDVEDAPPSNVDEVLPSDEVPSDEALVKKRGRKTKDQKDPKEPKDKKTKDQKEPKEPKEPKASKVTKTKEPKAKKSKKDHPSESAGSLAVEAQ